ncbi:MAG: condensation domain-containing protein, partial [Burkholderiales bacterium]
IAALYAKCLSAAASPLPQLPIQYADYAIWQRSVFSAETLERELAYWKQRLHGAPDVLDLPTDRPRRAVCAYAGGRQAVTLPSGLMRALTELSQSEGVSLFMTLLAAYQALLAQFTEQKDILVAAPIAGRNRRETESLIGVFTNVLVLRADCSGDQSFRGLLGRARDTTLSAYAHQDLPFHLLVEELQPEWIAGLMPLAQVSFNFQNVAVPAPRLPGLLLRPILVEHIDASDESVEPEHVRAFRSSNHAVKFDLALFTWPHGDELRGHLEYNRDLFEAKTIEELVAHYKALLEAIATKPDRRLADLPPYPSAGHKRGQRSTSA